MTNLKRPNLQLKTGYIMLFIAVFVLPQSLFSNGLNYSFANERDSISGTDTFYLVDVMVATQTPTPQKIGMGRIYFDYNEDAFGTLVGANPSTLVHSNNPSYLLGTMGPNGYFLHYYYVHTGSDLTGATNRFYVGWDQYIAEDCLNEEVTQTPRKLFGVQLKYIPGGSQFLPDLCFSMDPSSINHVLSSCGPFSGMTCDPGNIVTDCVSHTGTVLLPNDYQCNQISNLTIVEPSANHFLYPNPAKDYLNVEIKNGQEASYQIFDLQGRLVKESMFIKRTTIDTNELPVGTYYLRLSIGVVEKIIVAR